jgi:membrane protein YdbS with pleckstrin-like domain
VADAVVAAAVATGVVVGAAGVAVLAGRARRHGVGAEAIVVERGALAWRRSLVPLDRVQSWSVDDQPFQRRAGLCTVSIHLAGHRSVRIVDASTAQADRVLEALGPPSAAIVECWKAMEPTG